jgi:hypothetical protein
MITVTKQPRTTLTDGFISKYSHIGNAVYFDLQREDTQIVANANYTGGYLAVAVDLETFSSVGSSVYVNAKAGTTTIVAGIYTITLKQTVLIGTTYFYFIVLNLSWSASYSAINAGFVNDLSLKNHRVGVVFISNAGDSVERDFVTNVNGICRIYANSLDVYFGNSLDTYFTTFNYNLLTDKVLNFSFKYREKWLNQTSDFIIVPATNYVVKSVGQLNTSNQLISNEVYFNSSSVKSTALFLTPFEKPVIFSGYDFSISALVTDVQAQDYATVIDGATKYVCDPADNGVVAFKIDTTGINYDFEFWLETSGGEMTTLNDYVDDYVDDYVVKTI